MPVFLKAMWGMDMPESFCGNYWDAIDAYDSSYQGVKAADFVECWHLFDYAALDISRNGGVGEQVVWRYDSEKEREKADEYAELERKMAMAIKEDW